MSPESVTHQAIFLDRDGVINENRKDHVKHWGEFRFLPGSLEALARLTRGGARIFVITNQAIINRGVVPRAVVDEVNDRMRREVAHRGGHIEAVAYCPHRPDEHCACRKPRPGLLLEIAERYSLNLQRCVMIGDALADMEAGVAAGCETMMVLTGRGRDELALATPGRRHYRVLPDLPAVADFLLSSVPVVA